MKLFIGLFPNKYTFSWEKVNKNSIFFKKLKNKIWGNLVLHHISKIFSRLGKEIRRSRHFGDCNWGKVAFWKLAILVIFDGFGFKMSNIAPFGLKIGLAINIDLNDGHIFKVLDEISNIWPKIGQVQHGRKGFKWS